MKYCKILTQVLFAVALIGCQKSVKPVTISTNFTSEEDKNVRLNNIISELSDTIPTDSEGFIIEIKEPQVAILDHGKTKSYLYLKPGGDLSISNDDENLSFTGSLAKENQFLQTVDQHIDSLRSNIGIRSIADVNEEEFRAKVDDKFSGLESFIQTSNDSEDLDKSLIALVNKRILAIKNTDLLSYKSFHDYLTKDSIVLSEDYYSFVEDLDYNDPDLLTFNEGRNYLERVVTKDVKYNNSIDEYYQDLFKSGANKITNPEVHEYFNFVNINNTLMFGTADNIQEFVDEFLSSSENNTMKSKINEALAKWEHLKKGKDAPAFDGVTKSGEIVQLSDLKGQNVYVDVWATWCGPCIAEIPSLKEVEKEFHGENITFVSVSIDAQKDKEKWAEFIAEKELGGTQIFEDGAWKSEIASNYNIKGIPRFILIDSEGKIVNANADRPSNPDLKDQLKALL